MWKMENGVFIHVVLPFLLLISSFFSFFPPEGRVCRTHLREKRAAEEWEMVQNSGGTESQKVIFSLKGCQAMSSQRKRRDKRRGEECGGVKSVYLPEESDSRLPANNPF